jgi:hypothetical protein
MTAGEMLRKLADYADKFGHSPGEFWRAMDMSMDSFEAHDYTTLIGWLRYDILGKNDGEGKNC